MELTPVHRPLSLHAYNVGPKKLEHSYALELRKFYQLDRSRPQYIYRYSGTTTKKAQRHCAEKKKNETMQASTRAESEEPEDEGFWNMQMVPTVHQLVSAPCAALWDERSPKYAGDVRIPPGMPIPLELEDRCHFFHDREHPSPVPYHVRNEAVPPGMAIPQQLEDRCHLVDRTWQCLMMGAGGASIQYTPLDKEWDLI